MDIRLIEEIRIDDQLLVQPKLEPGESYQYIYRTGSGVTWKAPYLCAREPAKWEYVKLFRQIVASVLDEYGQQLVTGPGTKWVAIPPDLRDAIVLIIAEMEC